MQSGGPLLRFEETSPQFEVDMLCSLARLVQVLRRSPWAVAVRFRPPPFQFHSKNNGLHFTGDDMVGNGIFLLILLPVKAIVAGIGEALVHVEEQVRLSL